MSIQYSYIVNNQFKYIDIPKNSLISYNDNNNYKLYNFQNEGVYKIYKSGGSLMNLIQRYSTEVIENTSGSFFFDKTLRKVIVKGVVNITNNNMIKPITVTLNIHNSTIVFNVDAVPSQTFNFNIQLTNEFQYNIYINYEFTSNDNFDVSGEMTFEYVSST